MSNPQQVVVKTADRISSASSCIAGCIYRVVQTTGPDGKNILNLIPIPKTAGNFVPLVPFSSTSETPKVNITSAIRVPLPPQLTTVTAATTATPVQIPTVQQSGYGKYILTRPLHNVIAQKDIIRVPPFTGNVASVTKVSPMQSNTVTVGKPPVPQFSLEPSSSKTNKGYMIVNARNVPATVKSPMLPSGHHLQIPANAEVKSVPASSLPPAIQQKILTAAAGASEANNPSKASPTVIYVSPVNTVKTALPKHLPNVSPKLVTEVPSPLLQTAASPGVLSNSSVIRTASSAGLSSTNEHQAQEAPMKWVVQENPQSSSPCLVPVVSSSDTASNILKNLAEMKYNDGSPASSTPLITNSSPVTGSQLAQIKDNALVMFNGKVYLLARRGSETVTTQSENQASPFMNTGKTSNDPQQRNESMQFLHASAGNQISNKVVNLVLSKNKGQNLIWKDRIPNLIRKDSIPKRTENVSDFILKNIKTEPTEVIISENEGPRTGSTKTIETTNSTVQSISSENLQRDRFIRNIPSENERPHTGSAKTVETTGATMQSISSENLQRDRFIRNLPSENGGPHTGNKKAIETTSATIQSTSTENLQRDRFIRNIPSDKEGPHTGSTKSIETTNATMQSTSTANLQHGNFMRNKDTGIQPSAPVSPAQKGPQQGHLTLQVQQRRMIERHQTVKKSARDHRSETKKSKKDILETGQKRTFDESQLRKKYGIHSDVRIHLERVSAPSFSTAAKESSASNAESTEEADIEILSVSGMPTTCRKSANNTKASEIVIKLERDSHKKRTSPTAVTVVNSKKKKYDSDNATEHANAESVCCTPRTLNDKTLSPKLLFSKQKLTTNSEGFGLENRAEPASGVNTEDTIEESSSSSTSLVSSKEEIGSSNKLLLESPADPDEIVRDEKIRRLKELLRQREAALEEIRKKMHHN